MLAPAAAAFVAARLSEFDPYWLPLLRRYTEGGVFTQTWMPVIAVLAVATSGLAWWSPRIGQLVAAAVLLVALPVVTFAGGGH